MDSQTLVSRALPSISSRIYSLSKAVVFRTYYYAAGSEARISGAGSRCLLSDTDSLAHATERAMSDHEKWLHHLLYSDPANPVLF